MRVLTVALLAALLSLPGATAALPSPPAGETEPVGAHSLYTYATQHSCSGFDPVLGLVSTDLTSTLQRVAEGSLSRYTIHLDAAPGDTTCPAIDVTFLSDAAWPTGPDQYNFGSIQTECGATGSFGFINASEFVYAQSFWMDVPAACGFAIPPGTALGFTMQPLQPQPALVCTPLVVVACSGA